ncbi:surface-adhesin E family protein [Caballeronia pedi]|uniref:surface-adhesin E family protein n=1 Tax=Caballeronia pedi TaxID=1777141 RepID=UPI001178A649|nr:surface-adhesin E family protein [Caballeronia pedi]
MRKPLHALAAVLAAPAFLLAAAEAVWVRVAASPESQTFVDAGSIERDAKGRISVWTRTVYAAPQRALGIPYVVDMTQFVLDCSNVRYRLSGGKIFDAEGKVLQQFDAPYDDLQPIPPSTKIDAVAKAVCTANGGARRTKN